MTHSVTPTPDPAIQRRRTVRIVLTVAVIGAVIATVVVLLTGGSDPATAPAVFITQPDFQPGATPPCLMHQTKDPNSAYQDGDEGSQSPLQLTFVAYYTAAGTEPFCDGQPPTDTDKTWANLYVQLTTSPDDVSSILGTG